MRRVAAELALVWRDARLRWIGAALVLLLSVAGLGAWQAASRHGADVVRITAAERSRWLGQDAKNPHPADHHGLWVFRQSSPLAALAPGTEPHTGRMVQVEAYLFNDAVYRAVQDAGRLARAGLGSVADVVGLVVPLAAILLGFVDILRHESHENGSDDVGHWRNLRASRSARRHCGSPCRPPRTGHLPGSDLSIARGRLRDAAKRGAMPAI